MHKYYASIKAQKGDHCDCYYIAIDISIWCGASPPHLSSGATTATDPNYGRSTLSFCYVRLGCVILLCGL